MVLMSITCVELDGWSLLPSSSTRLRCAPSPRRFSVACPLSLRPFEKAVEPGANCGNWFSAPSSVVLPVAAIASLLTVTIGLVA